MLANHLLRGACYGQCDGMLLESSLVYSLVPYIAVHAKPSRLSKGSLKNTFANVRLRFLSGPQYEGISK